MNAARLLGVSIVASLLSSCALRDPPKRSDVEAQALPGMATPGQWQSGDTTGVVEDDWLTAFEDPRLNALVTEAIANNPDMLLAAARIEQAAAYVEKAGAKLYPQVHAIANVSGSDASGGGLNFAGAFASWELDLWGRIRAGREATSQQLISIELETEYARQSLAAMVARGWFLATEARLQRAIADDMVEAAAKLVELARQRQAVGIGDDYDIAVSEAALATYRDSAEQLELAERQSIQAIEVLIGRYPAAELEVPAVLATLPGPVPAGLPSELLERRLDVVASERRVAIAFYRIEEAKAARLPSISLTGSFSTISSDLLVIKERDDPVWGWGGRAAIPLYLGGALDAEVAVRTAEQRAAVAEYGRAAAMAFAEVEQALSANFTLQAREPLLTRSVAENRRALRIAEDRYQVGIGDLRAVEQRQLQLFGTQSTLLRVQSERLVQRVNLHLALGGSFDSPPTSSGS